MFKVKVIKDLSKMQKFQNRMHTNIMKKGLRNGATIVKKALVMVVPKVSQALKKSIGYKVVSFNGGTIWYAVVGPRSSDKFSWHGQIKQPSRYFHFVDAGKGGHPILIPTRDLTREIYILTVERTIAAEIDKVLSGR